MRRSLLVKVQWSLLGRKTSLCQGTKDPGVFKYFIRGCQERCCVESKGKEGKRQRAVYETIGKGANLGRLRVTLMLAIHTVSQHLHEKKGYCLFCQLRGPYGYRDITDPWPKKTGQ